MSRTTWQCCWLAAVVAGGSSGGSMIGRPAAHWRVLTVFHVNPARYGDVPGNMNSADARGDMLFSLQSAMAPMLCELLGSGNASAATAGSLSCGNAETTGPDLLVTKLQLSVDGHFDAYQMCNICVDGKDPAPAVAQAGWRKEHTPPGQQLSCDTQYITAAAGKIAQGATNCSSSHCWKFQSADGNTSVSGCDTSGVCATQQVPAGGCHELAAAGGLRLRCSEAGRDFPAPLSLEDFAAPCPALRPVIGGGSAGAGARNCSMLPAPEYVCDCPGGNCGSTKVGAQNLSTTMGEGSPGAAATRKLYGTSAWRESMASLGVVGAAQELLLNATFYRLNLADKLGGMWFSTPSAGMCGGSASSAGNASTECSWRVTEVEKRVSKACADASVYAYVEAASPSCFAACRPADAGGGHRDTSDPCWVGCLFATILGPDAGRAGGGGGGGLSLAQLEEAWARPFASEDRAAGGCPALPEFWVAPAAGPAAASGPGPGGRQDAQRSFEMLKLAGLLAGVGGVVAALLLCCIKRRKQTAGAGLLASGGDALLGCGASALSFTTEDIASPRRIEDPQIHGGAVVVGSSKGSKPSPKTRTTTNDPYAVR